MVDMLYCTSYFCDTLVLKHTLPAISHCGRKYQLQSNCPSLAELSPSQLVQLHNLSTQKQKYMDANLEEIYFASISKIC